MLFGLLILFVLFNYLRWHNLLQDAHLMRALLVVLAVAMFFIWRKVAKSRIITVMLLFLLLILALMPLARFTLSAYFTFLGLAKVVTIALIMFAVVDSWKRLAVLVAVLLAIHGYLAFANITSFSSLEMGDKLARLGAVGMAQGSWLGDANDFALALNIVLPLGILLLLSQRGMARIALLACCGLIVAGVVTTYSRGGFVTLTGALVGIWFLRGRKLGVMAVAALVAVGLLVMSPQLYLERMETITTVDKDDTSYGRLQLWKAGLLMMADYPLTGVGPGAYKGAYGRDYLGQTDHYSSKWKVAHSAYITIAAETGLPGLLLYLYLLYLAFKENLATRRLLLERASPAWQVAICEGLICGLLAYAIGSTFITVCYSDHLYVLAALSAALGGIVQREFVESAVEPQLAPWAAART